MEDFVPSFDVLVVEFVPRFDVLVVDPVDVLREAPDDLVVSPVVFTAGEPLPDDLPLDMPPVTTLPEAAGRSLVSGDIPDPSEPTEPAEPLVYPLGSDPRVPPEARVEPKLLFVRGIGATF